MTKPKEIPGKTHSPRRKWTPAEDLRLSVAYPDTPTAELAAEFNCKPSQIHDHALKLGVRKSKAFMTEFLRECAKRAGAGSIAHRFQPGLVPWNKGVHFRAGGRSAETRFKPKNIPHTWMPLGSERHSKNGYRQRKMTDTGYPPRDWVPVHHIIWRDAGNEIPKGHALVFRDGDKTNIVLENLELITRQELMRRNSYHQYGPEIVKAIQLRGAVIRQINKRARKEEDHEQQT
jgi:hypothetical protein